MVPLLKSLAFSISVNESINAYFLLLFFPIISTTGISTWSLEYFVKNSGLKVKNINGFQRYPLSNHFNWLLNGQPSGQNIYKNFNNKIFSRQYEKLLDRIDQTDTLIGHFGLS